MDCFDAAHACIATLNRTMNTGDEGATFHKRIKSDKVVLATVLEMAFCKRALFQKLIAGMSLTVPEYK